MTRRAEEAVAPPSPTTLHRVPARHGFALALHGGAGGRIRELSGPEQDGFRTGLERAWAAGAEILSDGGSAMDAVCAAVREMEEDPLFNAGRGAALNTRGEAELDASVMDGESGAAGAVAASRHARSAVSAARAVMERTDHVLIVAPPAELVEAWELETAEPEWFVTDKRLQQLQRVLAERERGPRHGTVGAVARDGEGHLAAATSTGGIVGQDVGRIGDTPVIGAGTYARDGLVAISCTGEGEAFLRGVVAHDIAARMRYGGDDVEEAVRGTIRDALAERGSSGGLVSVTGEGEVVVAFNSAMMFTAYHDGSALRVLT